jgi:hypothetical protein
MTLYDRGFAEASRLKPLNRDMFSAVIPFLPKVCVSNIARSADEIKKT